MMTRNPRRVYTKNEKSIPGWGYWGEFDEIEIGLSSGREESTENLQTDPLHYHQKGTVFILVLEGSGVVEVEGQSITISKNEVLRVAPGEKYRHTGVVEAPFSWITICTSKDPDDKVVVKEI